MAKRDTKISDQIKTFIEKQKIYFVATATQDSHINLSPKGMDSLKIINSQQVIWLNLTGSGNETAAHLQEDKRMTIMLTAFEGAPLIVRLYGNATAIHKNDPEWKTLYAKFEPLPGARQIFILDIDLVQSSCGMATPFFDFVAERTQLSDWSKKIGEKGIQKYWQDKNQTSLDGKPTHITNKNL